MTTSGSTGGLRDESRLGLVPLAAGSLGLVGLAAWQVLSADSSNAGVALTAGAIASLLCLFGAVLVAAGAQRERRRTTQPSAVDSGQDLRAISRPRTAEQAAAMAHAQKMEALGLLAAGVAHDFNNLLHVIRNSLGVLERQRLEPQGHRYLEMIGRSAERAAALTRHLLVFCRQQPLDPRPIDPNDLIAQVTELLRHCLGERIAIRTVLDREVWSVAADSGQLETALLNLAINARDAMPGSGLITIETTNTTLEESGQCISREYVAIAVSDTGVGMTPEVAARACEPFFTTKAPGRGTGLGLSQVAGFARQSGGQVRIASAEGRGTTVRLFLPRSGERPAEAIAPAHRPKARARAMRCGALAVDVAPEG